MNVASFIKNKIAQKKAERVGISKEKYMEYKAKRDKELFLQEQKAEREQELKLANEKAKLKTEQKLSVMKQRNKRKLKRTIKGQMGGNPNVFGTSGSKFEYGGKGLQF